MKKWFVICTRTRQELSVSKELSLLGIENFCPTIVEIKHYSDRKKKLIKPIIPSYIMVYIEEKNRNIVFSLKGIIRYLFFLGEPVEVKEEEIKLMKKHLEGVHHDFVLSKIIKGDEYKIKEGPFAGHNGTVLESDKTKIKLSIKSLALTVVLRKAA